MAPMCCVRSAKTVKGYCFFCGFCLLCVSAKNSPCGRFIFLGRRVDSNGLEGFQNGESQFQKRRRTLYLQHVFLAGSSRPQFRIEV